MKLQDVREQILKCRIIPVVRAASPELAMEIARRIAAGGIPIIELTLTVPDAIDAIAELSRTMKHAVIGAGTVLDPGDAQRCLDAGAQFVVAPGFDADTVKLVRENDVLMIPGALTPTEVINAWRSGCEFVKIFPCGSAGGPSHIKALKSALPQIQMIPTGGVNLSNAKAFFCAGASAIGVGGELTSAPDIADAARQFLCVAQGANYE
jgi:2-dehydro-3-deoxyphosphogluconate aldolase/(4S)-4-hydroxy-2-oxoglutarate aldolase